MCNTAGGNRSDKQGQPSLSSDEVIAIARRDLYDNVIYVRQVEVFLNEYPVTDRDWTATYVGNGMWSIEANVGFDIINIATQKKLDKRKEYRLGWNFYEGSRSLSLTARAPIR